MLADPHHWERPPIATRIKSRPSESYDADFHIWIEREAELLRARRFEELDLDDLIEEMEGLARVEVNAVLSNASVIVEHLLKIEHSPATEQRAGLAHLGAGAPAAAAARAALSISID